MAAIDGLTEEQNEIIQAVDAALHNAQRSSLPQRRMDQIYVCLAYEMFNLDLEERGFALLKKADPEYFKTHFQRDIEDDEQFRYITTRIVSKLIEIGVVKVTGK